MGQHPGMMQQGGMPVRMPQGQPFIGGGQPQLQAGISGARAPGPPGAPAGFFPHGPGMQGVDPRLLQERQLQHRMQMSKLQQQQQQQQVTMGQQSVPHPNQQPGLIPQSQSGMIGNHLMVQQQANTQQGMMTHQANQHGMVQVPQGLVGGQSVVASPQNPVGGQHINHTQAMIAPQPGIMGNQQVPSSLQQRPQVMMSQQGMAGSPGDPGLRSPQNELTPQQQSLLAHRMSVSQQQQQQQQNISKNYAHQHQVAQQRQPTQVISQPNQEFERLSQPSTPQMGSSPSTGSITPQPQGVTDSQSTGPKEGVILSPDPKTPQQPSGPSTPSQVTQPSFASDHQTELERQQAQQHPNQLCMAQQQSNSQSASEQQLHSAVNQMQQQQHLAPAVQRQGLGAEQLSSIAEAGKTDLAQQHHQQTADHKTLQQTVEPNTQQQMMVQSHPGQPQPVVMDHNAQQQAFIAQQQKQQALMGMMRAQQQGMIPQRPGFPSGQIRIPASLAQNPQFRSLPPNQQIQHIQAMIAQRQLQHGQMMRVPLRPGHQNQLRPLMPPGQMQPGQMQQPGQQAPGIEGQQMPYGTMGKPGAAGTMQHLAQQPGVAPQIQHRMMGPGHQQPPVGVMMQQQHNMRGQIPMPRSPMDQSRMIRPQSPRQPVPNSPVDPQRQGFNQPMGMRPPTPNQNQQQAFMNAAAAGRMQGSPSHAYSPRVPFGMSPAHPSSPHSSYVSSPSACDSGAGRGSPYNQIKASPLRSPGAKSPLDCPGLKLETQTLGSETCDAMANVQNGSQKGPGVPQYQSQQAAEGHLSHLQHTSREDQVCKMTLQNIKQEPREIQCDGTAEPHSGFIKREDPGETFCSGNNTNDPESQGPRSETGQQLLQKLLRTKNLQLGAQRPEGIHNEINGHINSKLAMLEQKLQGTPQNMEVSLFHFSQHVKWLFTVDNLIYFVIPLQDLQSITKRAPIQKPKRTNKATADRGANARKKNRKDEVGKSADVLLKQLKQVEDITNAVLPQLSPNVFLYSRLMTIYVFKGLSLLPLMEPSITASLDLFAPFGSSPSNGKAQLKGSFGNAVLDNIPDYYSQLLTKVQLSQTLVKPKWFHFRSSSTDW